MKGILVFIIVGAVLCLSCNDRSGKSSPQRSDSTNFIDSAAVSHDSTISFHLPDSLIDGRYAMRDMATDSLYEVLEADGLLVLRSGDEVLDTLHAFPYHGGLYGHAVTSFDSAFITLEGVWRGNSGTGETEIFCVADRQLVKSADFNMQTHMLGYPERGEYMVNHTWKRDPYRLQCVESYDRYDISGDLDKGPQRTGGWSRTHTLRFDTLRHVLYNHMIELDSVPGKVSRRVDSLSDWVDKPMPIDTAHVTITSNAVSGRYPGIAFLYATNVFIDGQWYSLCSNTDNQEAFERGTQHLIRSGSGRAGDHLTPLR